MPGRGGGVRFFIENPRRGGVSRRVGPRGREGVCSELGNWGGGAKYFLFGAETLSFFSLVFLFPWCFACCGNPWSFWVFSAYFTGFLRVREVILILGVFEVFLGIYEKTKEKKDRECPPRYVSILRTLIVK